MEDEEMELPESRGITLGEVGRRVDRVESAMLRGFRELDVRIASLSLVTREEFSAELAAIKQRLDASEDHRRWLMRTIVGVVIANAVALLWGITTLQSMMAVTG